MASSVFILRAGGLHVFKLGHWPYCFQIVALCICPWFGPNSHQKHYSPESAPDADPPDRMKGKMGSQPFGLVSGIARAIVCYETS